MKRRVLTVALAVILAVLGTGGVLAYVHQADARALAGQRAVTVLVATSLIPAGTSVSQAAHDGSLVSQRLPAESVPADALGSISPDLSTLVASADIQPGELLLRPMLVAAGQAAAAVAIPRGMVAVTLALCMPEAVAGYIRPGSQVALFDTYSAKSMNGSDCGGTHSGGGTRGIHTRIVLPRVQVLSVGSASANAQATGAQAGSSAFSQPGTSTQSGPVLVTLAVNQADAERVIMLSESGLPYLALLTSSSQTKFDSTTVPLFQP